MKGSLKEVTAFIGIIMAEEQMRKALGDVAYINTVELAGRVAEMIPPDLDKLSEAIERLKEECKFLMTTSFQIV